jgi:hypothetical protein
MLTMDALPFLQKDVTVLDHLGDEAPHIGSLDANTRHDSGYTIRPKQVDFRLSRPDDVDTGRFMIERVDDEPEAVSTMDDNHGLI